MGNFIQLNDINGVLRFVNVNLIACVEPHDDNAKIILAIAGRGEYSNFAFISVQSYDTVVRLINDSM